ncbi:IS66 family insertion sequence element accessory protein TnpB [Enterococcus sp. DIV1420a]|uniref:IS66 family insertion sequence element accessory protein TnpB n=1 Tax=Enterococcus sp. DIV1420a TaxID=2774672 RepID=UPI003F27BA83
MIVDYTKVKYIYIVCGKTDMRRSIDGLAAIIMDQYALDAYSDVLFLFCGGRLDRFKALYWEAMVFFSSIRDLKMGTYVGPESVLK